MAAAAAIRLEPKRSSLSLLLLLSLSSSLLGESKLSSILAGAARAQCLIPSDNTDV